MMRVAPNRQWTDAEILEVLHMRDHEGMTAKEIAAQFGVTRNAIAGLWDRIAKASRNDNGVGDGSMAPGWWRRTE